MKTISTMVSLDDEDLSSLLALDALLQERHVTRAAARLGVTQSSMSHRLQRLRERFSDPLLVRSRDGLLLTPRAEAMAGPLADALERLRHVVRAPERFDPATSTRTFSLAMPDLLAPLVPTLVEALSSAAPGAALQVLPGGAQLSVGLARGEPLLALMPTRDADASLVQRSLGPVRFGVAMAKRHPLAKGALTVERWLSAPHVVVKTGTSAPNLVGEALSKRGLARRVGLEVSSFLSGLVAVAGSRLVMNAPLALLDELAPRLGLIIRAAPVPMPDVKASLAWHERFQGDAAHRWWRDLVFGAVATRLGLSAATRSALDSSVHDALRR